MSIEISNLSGAACHVDTQFPLGSFVPSFKGNGKANAGFAPFAPTPAPPDKSERLGPGSYRLHLIQSFNFRGDASAIASINTPSGRRSLLSLPGIKVFGMGPTPVALGGGSDLFVQIVRCCDEVFPAFESSEQTPTTPVAEDWDFTVLLLNFPVQLTQPQ